MPWNNSNLGVFSDVIGWTAFAAWSLSFYPQVILNFRRKSVVGLNFDFLALNILKHSSYGLFNFLLYFDKVVQRQSQEYYHNDNGSSVETNDVVFSAHAILLTAITIFQCTIYERGNQKVSLICRLVLGLAMLWVLFNIIISASNNTGFTGVPNWLWFALAMNGMQIFLSCCKYSPQVFMNWQRKSTVGWSIHNIILDITGGLLNLVQNIVVWYDHDPTQFEKNWGKTALSLLTIIYDLIFIVQHYVLYTDRVEYRKLDHLVGN